MTNLERNLEQDVVNVAEPSTVRESYSGQPNTIGANARYAQNYARPDLAYLQTLDVVAALLIAVMTLAPLMAGASGLSH